jgi:peptide/nickel transport system substrate-binding protein
MNELSYWHKVLRERVTRRRALAGAGALTASAAFLAACGGDDDDDGGGTTTGSGSAPRGTGDPKPGGVFRTDMIAEDPAHYDLHQAASFGISEEFTLAYNQMVKFSETELGIVEPDLASSWEQPDNLTITFKLVEANFHDGTPFSSADVKATFERVKNPPANVVSVRKAWFEPVSRIETPDQRTAVFHLTRPSAFLFTGFGSHNMGIYSAKNLQADPLFPTKKENGTGPYMLDQVNQGSRYTFKKNPNYFVKGRPYLDRIEFNIIPEAVARFAAWRSKNLDMYSPQATDVAEVQGISDATYIKTGGTAYWVISVPTWKQPWNDDRIWKAIALAVNKDDFNKAQFLGTSSHGGPMPPGSEWSLSEQDLLRVPGYKGLGDGKESTMDARWAEAKKLLSAASFDPRQERGLFSWDTASFSVWAEVILDGLRNVGMENVKLTLVDRGTYDERLSKRDYGDMAGNSRSAVIPDPTPVFADSYIEGAGRHYSGLVIPEVEDLFVKQEAELDHNKRFALQNEMQKKFLAKWPLDISVFTVTNEAIWNHVKDYGPIYSSMYQGRKYEGLWLDA